MRSLVPFVLCLALSACALSPQTVQIQPQPEVQHRNLGNNQAVSVSATDQRPQQAFGSRGGIYGNTSLIRPANDVVQALITAVKRNLQSLGFNAYNAGSDAVNLDVQLKELSYVPEAGSVVNRVEITAVIVGQARNARGDEYIGTYKAGNTYEQPLTPTARQNEERLNEVLGRALQQMLTDPKMLSFLAGPGGL